MVQAELRSMLAAIHRASDGNPALELLTEQREVLHCRLLGLNPMQTRRVELQDITRAGRGRAQG